MDSLAVTYHLGIDFGLNRGKSNISDLTTFESDKIDYIMIQCKFDVPLSI